MIDGDVSNCPARLTVTLTCSRCANAFTIDAEEVSPTGTPELCNDCIVVLDDIHQELRYEGINSYPDDPREHWEDR